MGFVLLITVSGCGDAGRIEELTADLDDARADLSAAEQELDAATSEIEQLNSVRADLDAARQGLEATVAERDDALTRLEAATLALTALEASVEVAEDAVSTAESAAQDEIRRAEEEMGELRAAFDGDLAAARAEFNESLESTLCEMAVDDPDLDIDVSRTIGRLVDADPRYVEAFKGFDLDAAFDHAGLTAATEECGARAALTADKGSGFYTVGDEIAPGRWRSTGSSDDCYWARLDEDQDILDNHFGDAGGSVTIQTSDYEVQFSDCGTWEYLDT